MGGLRGCDLKKFVNKTTALEIHFTGIKNANSVKEKMSVSEMPIFTFYSIGTLRKCMNFDFP